MTNSQPIIVDTEAPTLFDAAFLLGEITGLKAKVAALTADHATMTAQIAERDARIAKLEREVERHRAHASSARGALLIQRTYGSQF